MIYPKMLFGLELRAYHELLKTPRAGTVAITRRYGISESRVRRLAKWIDAGNPIADAKAICDQSRYLDGRFIAIHALKSGATIREASAVSGRSVTSVRSYCRLNGIVSPLGPPARVQVYCLRCPTTGSIRYVGAAHNAAARLVQHLNKSHSTAIQAWIAELRSRELSPVCEVLAVCDAKSWRAIERHWINYMRETGQPILNIR